jgi:hypothetical protein
MVCIIQTLFLSCCGLPLRYTVTSGWYIQNTPSHQSYTLVSPSRMECSLCSLRFKAKSLCANLCSIAWSLVASLCSIAESLFATLCFIAVSLGACFIAGKLGVSVVSVFLAGSLGASLCSLPGSLGATFMFCRWKPQCNFVLQLGA